MSQKLIEQELIDPLPTFMSGWTSLMKYAIKNNIKIVNYSSYNHGFTIAGVDLEKKFGVNYMNCEGGCLVTEAFGGFDNHGNKPYDSKCCGSFVYHGAIKALTSWDNFIQYKVELYDHIVQNHPNVKI